MCIANRVLGPQRHSPALLGAGSLLGGRRSEFQLRPRQPPRRVPVQALELAGLHLLLVGRREAVKELGSRPVAASSRTQSASSRRESVRSTRQTPYEIGAGSRQPARRLLAARIGRPSSSPAIFSSPKRTCFLPPSSASRLALPLPAHPLRRKPDWLTCPPEA